LIQRSDFSGRRPVERVAALLLRTGDPAHRPLDAEGRDSRDVAAARASSWLARHGARLLLVLALLHFFAAAFGLVSSVLLAIGFGPVGLLHFFLFFNLSVVS
jgi:hypothetical protein